MVDGKEIKISKYCKYSVERLIQRWVVLKNHIKISSQQYSMVEGFMVCGFTASGAKQLAIIDKKWMPRFFRTFCWRIRPSVGKLSSTKLVWCNSTRVNQQHNGFNRRKYGFVAQAWPQHDWDDTSDPKYCWTETV